MPSHGETCCFLLALGHCLHVCHNSIIHLIRSSRVKLKFPKKKHTFFYMWLDKAMPWDNVTGTQKPGSYPIQGLTHSRDTQYNLADLATLVS